MKCQNCKKNEASVRYYENINGKSQKIYLCSDCAEKLGISQFENFSNFNEITNFFSPMFATIPEFNIFQDEKCPVCGYSIEDYTNSGLLGCPECYNTFRENIDKVLYKINGKAKHVGLNKFNRINKKNLDYKSNSKFNEINKINELKKELKNAIKEERYEDAAILRDKIKEEEKK